MAIIRTVLRNFLEAQDFWYCESHEAFVNRWPARRRNVNEYRPEPYIEPEEYPCMIKDEGTMPNPDGADHVMLSIVELNVND